MSGAVLDRLIHGNTRDEYNAAHETMKNDDGIWQTLAFAGIQHDGQGQLTDLRHCPFCQSTILRPIAPSDALFLCQVQAEIHARSMGAVSDAVDVARRPPDSRRPRKVTARVVLPQQRAPQQSGIESVGQP